MIDIHKAILHAILEPILTPDEEQLRQLVTPHEQADSECLPVGEALAQALDFIEMTQALADKHWEQVERDKLRRQRCPS